MGTLYLVATPIGNLEDITHRAVRILREVQLIAAEDTRRTRRLLSHYDIHTPITSYHEHNKDRKTPQLLSSLKQGNVALVSDAGTPGLSDPGYMLTRAAIESGHLVSPIPGPSAPIAALVASGLPSDTFLFLGYPSRKHNERRTAFSNVANLSHTLIFLETPHRLLDTLADLRDVLGERQIVVAREMTKIHEEILRCSLNEAIIHFEQEPPRGEFTLVVTGCRQEKSLWDEDRLRQAIKSHLVEGRPASEIAKQLAKESSWPRREVYQLINKMN
jgi:16S rRNA (cytidine1402-2'-O)-methyltransferase